LQFLDLLNKLISVPVALGQLILHGQQLTLRDTFGMKSGIEKGRYRVGGRHVQCIADNGCCIGIGKSEEAVLLVLCSALHRGEYRDETQFVTTSITASIKNIN
jgi:hypothetical protein